MKETIGDAVLDVVVLVLSFALTAGACVKSHVASCGGSLEESASAAKK